MASVIVVHRIGRSVSIRASAAGIAQVLYYLSLPSVAVAARRAQPIEGPVHIHQVMVGLMERVDRHPGDRDSSPSRTPTRCQSAPLT